MHLFCSFLVKFEFPHLSIIWKIYPFLSWFWFSYPLCFFKYWVQTMICSCTNPLRKLHFPIFCILCQNLILFLLDKNSIFLNILFICFILPVSTCLIMLYNLYVDAHIHPIKVPFLSNFRKFLTNSEKSDFMQDNKVG